HRDGAIRLPNLLDRYQAFELVAKIDDQFLSIDFDDMSLQQLTFRGRRQMAIILDEVLVVLFNGRIEIHVPFVCAAGHDRSSGQPVEESILQKDTGAGSACQLTFSAI